MKLTVGKLLENHLKGRVVRIVRVRETYVLAMIVACKRHDIFRVGQEIKIFKEVWEDYKETGG